MIRQIVFDASRLPIRAALAAVLGVGIAQWLVLPFPIYAMISAVIVTDVSAIQTRRLAVPRLAGTLIGAALGAMINLRMQPGLPAPWILGLGIFVPMFITCLLRLPSAAKVAGYVCGIIVLSHVENPWHYALHRTFETILGIGTAVLVSLVPRLVPNEEAK